MDARCCMSFDNSTVLRDIGCSPSVALSPLPSLVDVSEACDLSGFELVSDVVVLARGWRWSGFAGGVRRFGAGYGTGCPTPTFVEVKASNGLVVLPLVGCPFESGQDTVTPTTTFLEVVVTELVSVDVQSPFDSMRQVRPDASEFWSGRELMSVTGYTAWRNFMVPIERAMQSAANQGVDVASNFARSRKVAGHSGPAQEDFELSRFAAYLVAMNGDPNKPEVAAAQAYFAIKTREAELVQSQIPETFSEALRVAADMHDRALQAEAAALEANTKVVELEPLAAEYERFLDANGTLELGGVANMLGIGRNKLFEHLRAEDVLQKNNRPYQRYAEWFRVQPYEFTDNHDRERVSFTSTLKPDALDPMRRLLVRRGRLAA